MATMSMATEELAELLLTALYDLAERAPHPYFLFSMNEFVPKLSGVDMARIREALYSLESRGLVYIASMDSWGNISAMVTPDGCVHVERGGETGVIEQYRKDPSSFVTETPPTVPELLQSPPLEYAPEPAMTTPPAHSPSEDVFDAMLGEMTEALEHEAGFDAARREDLLSDVKALKLQLGKQTINRAVVMGLLESLSSVPSLFPLVRLFVRLLESKAQ